MKLSAIILFLLATCSLNAQTYSISSQKTTVLGSSNVQNWEASVEKVTGTAQLTLDETGALTNLDKLNVRMEVKSMKSNKGSTMDGKMYSALKSDSNPNIVFEQTRLQSLSRQGNSYNLVLVGQLQIAGTRKTITLRATGTPVGSKWQFTGEAPLNMTDFNIDPPTAMLGAMRTYEEITINFDVTFSAR